MFDIGGEFLPAIPFRENIQHGRYEGNHLQDLGFILWNASGSHVELLVFIQLAYGSSMRTFHVIGIDFQLRLCVNPCSIGKEEVVVFLICFRDLGIRVHDYPAVESRPRLAGNYSLEKLMGRAVMNPVKQLDIDGDIRQEAPGPVSSIRKSILVSAPGMIRTGMSAEAFSSRTT